MKISYSCLIVAVVIGLGTVTATPADDVKAVEADAADAAKLADYENDAKLAGLVRGRFEAAECCTEPSCRSYRGKIARTISGKTCQAWNKQTPHKHTRTPQNYPLSGLVNNYCRNPDGQPWAWCYTVYRQRRYERCNIPRCEVSCDSTWTARNHKTSRPKTCHIYAQQKYCANGTYGSAWLEGWGTFTDWRDSKGRTALVCPECGCKEI